MPSVEVYIYKNQNKTEGLEKKFLKRSYLDECLKNIEASVNNYLNAAWATVDSKNQKSTTGNRLKASSLLLQIIYEMPRRSENFTTIST